MNSLETYHFRQSFAGAGAALNRTICTFAFNTERWVASARFTMWITTAGVFTRYPAGYLNILSPTSGPIYTPANQNFALSGGSTDENGFMRFYQGPTYAQFVKYDYRPGEAHINAGTTHTVSYVTEEIVAVGETIFVLAELGFWLPSQS